MSLPPSHDPRCPPHQPVWAERFGQDKYGIYAEFTVNRALFVLRWCPPGSFLMGSPETEEHEGPQQWVTLTDGFWLGETAVTQSQWQAVMGNNPSYYRDRQQNPVEHVSWDDCAEFHAKLQNIMPEFETGFPTEAQWEYACRAGTITAYHFGEKFDRQKANFGFETVPVKSYHPNAFGFYEMNGNVWEWCLDLWDQSPIPSNENFRVVRGGGTHNFAHLGQSFDRNGGGVTSQGKELGFRLAAPQQLKI